MSKVQYIPKGYNTVTPYLVIKGAAKAIEYYKKVSAPRWSCAWMARAARSATPSCRSAIRA